MSTILFAWELGGGLGHATRIQPIAEALVRRGHRVVVVAKDLAAVARVFDRTPVVALQAPFFVGRAARPIQRPASFAHILHNVGFDNERQLAVLAEAWSKIFEWVGPDVIVCDHSPTALLAARRSRAKRVALGDSFCVPPDRCPLPDLRPWLGERTHQLRRDEDELVDRVNRVLAVWKRPPLARLSEVYANVDDTFLVTIPELDHFASERTTGYVGVPVSPGGCVPEWPKGDGPRVFCYLRPFPNLPVLLTELANSKAPTLAVIPGLSAEVRQRFSSTTLRFPSQLLDLTQVALSCDLAVVHATHNTTAVFLMEGKPVAMIPTQLEQSLLARRVSNLGAGIEISLQFPEDVKSGFGRLAGSSKLRMGAERIRSANRGFYGEQPTQVMADRLERLVAC